MKASKTALCRFVLPLPTFIFHPLTAVLIAATHVYLAAGHLLKLFGGEVTWTNIWKGFGALAGAYVFAALVIVFQMPRFEVLPIAHNHDPIEPKSRRLQEYFSHCTVGRVPMIPTSATRSPEG